MSQERGDFAVELGIRLPVRHLEHVAEVGLHCIAEDRLGDGPAAGAEGAGRVGSGGKDTSGHRIYACLRGSVDTFDNERGIKLILREV